MGKGFAVCKWTTFQKTDKLRRERILDSRLQSSGTPQSLGNVSSMLSVLLRVCVVERGSLSSFVKLPNNLLANKLLAHLVLMGEGQEAIPE